MPNSRPSSAVTCDVAGFCSFRFTDYCRGRIIGRLMGFGGLRGGGSPGRGLMPNFLQSTAAQVVIWLAVCAALVAVGIFVVAKVRQTLSESEPETHELLANFRELHSQGELSDEEYRTIKAKLAARLQREIKGKGDGG